MDYIKKYEESSSLSSIRSWNYSVDISARSFVGYMIADLFINLLPFLIFLSLIISFERYLFLKIVSRTLLRRHDHFLKNGAEVLLPETNTLRNQR